MVLELLFSSIVAGALATLVMMVFQYAPVLWGGGLYDVIGSLGSAVVRETGPRAERLGVLVNLGMGIFFAFFYGLITLGLIAIESELPQMMILGGAVNLFDVTIGAVVGLGHGLFVAILLVIMVIEHHPIPDYRSNFFIVPSAIIGHVIYGSSVMFFHNIILRGYVGGGYW